MRRRVTDIRPAVSWAHLRCGAPASAVSGWQDPYRDETGQDSEKLQFEDRCSRRKYALIKFCRQRLDIHRHSDVRGDTFGWQWAKVDVIAFEKLLTSSVCFDHFICVSFLSTSASLQRWEIDRRCNRKFPDIINVIGKSRQDFRLGRAALATKSAGNRSVLIGRPAGSETQGTWSALALVSTPCR